MAAVIASIKQINFTFFLSLKLLHFTFASMQVLKLFKLNVFDQMGLPIVSLQ